MSRRASAVSAAALAGLAFIGSSGSAVRGEKPPEWSVPGDRHDRIRPLDLQITPKPGRSTATAPAESLLAFAAFVEDNWDIYTWDLQPDHPPVRRTHTPYDEAAPSLASDHSFCVYESVDGRLWRLALKPDATPEALPFGSDQRFDMHPAASPDGPLVVMATSLNRATDDTDLVVYDTTAGAFGRRLELISYQHYPAWAPDGVHVVFSNLQGRLQTGRPICELWVMRTDAPWARQLTLLDGLAISPSWSPRGDRIAFTCAREGSFDVWLLDPVSRACARLTEDEAADTDPVFSPDGRSIIFVSTRGGRTGLWRIDVDDRRPVPVAPFGEFSAVPCKDPDWK